ncbi:MAG: hypothetical protein PHN75_13595 [Syntrophales bacterium]|nr:hypothetical protein [Syntrophales bacterium]
MGRCFCPEEMSLAGKAFYNAEKLALRHFRIDPAGTKNLRYDVKTLAYLDNHEVKEGAFAHLCKYEYEDGYFYRICLQDSSILDAVTRAHSFIKLNPLMLYIAAHELVHVIRFDKGEANFDVSLDEKKLEEEKVHNITNDLLQPCMNQELRLVLDCFSNRYHLGEIFC